MIKSIIKRYVTIILVVATIALAAFFIIRNLTAKKETITVRPAVVTDVKSMARLCTVEIYSEIPVKDTVGSKVILAVQKQRGSVSFDMDRLDVDASGDTVRAILSPEIVELYESTDDNAYDVIDTKSLSLLRSGKLTNAEDNIVKQRIRKRSIHRLYKEGVIANARKEARTNLASLLGKLYRKPVVVRDTMPKGKLVRTIRKKVIRKVSAKTGA